MAKKKTSRTRAAQAKPASLEEEIRAIPRLCRGPKTQDPAAALTQLTTGRWKIAGEDGKALAKVKKAGGTTDEMIGTLLGPHPVAARLLDRATRTFCGQDFNDLILGGPLDGEDHEVPCPRCGTVIHYTAPLAPASVS